MEKWVLIASAGSLVNLTVAFVCLLHFQNAAMLYKQKKTTCLLKLKSHSVTEKYENEEKTQTDWSETSQLTTNTSIFKCFFLSLDLIIMNNKPGSLLLIALCVKIKKFKKWNLSVAAFLRRPLQVQ